MQRSFLDCFATMDEFAVESEEQFHVFNGLGQVRSARRMSCDETTRRS